MGVEEDDEPVMAAASPPGRISTRAMKKSHTPLFAQASTPSWEEQLRQSGIGAVAAFNNMDTGVKYLNAKAGATSYSAGSLTTGGAISGTTYVR